MFPDPGVAGKKAAAQAEYLLESSMRSADPWKEISGVGVGRVGGPDGMEKSALGTVVFRNLYVSNQLVQITY